MKRILPFVVLLVLAITLPVLGAYTNTVNVGPSTGASVSASFTRPSDGRAAIQCWGGGIARIATGATTATAVNNAGLRVFSDAPPEPYWIPPTHDKVAIILDAASSGTVTCSISQSSKGAN